MKKLFQVSILFILIFLVSGKCFSQRNWSIIYSGQPSMLKSIFFANINTGFAVGSGVILKSVNGGLNWTIISHRLNLKSVYFLNAQTGFVIGKSNDSGFVIKTTNSGSSWDSYYLGYISPSSEYQRIFFKSNSTLTGYVMHEGAVYHRTTNAGLFWVLNVLSGNDIMDIGWSSNNSYVFKVGRQTHNGNFKPYYSTSTDEINWGSANFCNECQNNDYGHRLFAFDTVKYLVTGSQYTPSTLYRLRASSATWEVIGGGAYIKPYLISGSYLYYGHPNIPNTYTRASSNGGNIWITDTLPDFTINDLFFLNTSIGFAAGDNGLIAKTVNGGGVIGISTISLIVPKKFSLNQNYPNPFNPTTNITFDIKSKGIVKLIVFDALGREVVTLVNQELQPGSYKTDWNAINYSSGIYFYKLETQNYIDSKKMILIK